jgi:hypothetical protein
MTKDRAGQGLFPLNGKKLRPYSIKISYLKFNRGCRRMNLMGGEIHRGTNGRMGELISMVKYVSDRL